MLAISVQRIVIVGFIEDSALAKVVVVYSVTVANHKVDTLM